MKNIQAIALMAAGAIALSTSVAVIAKAAAPAPAAPPPPLEILDFKPGFDDLMTLLIQPRHMKLWAAGQSGNWTLAAFQLRELRNAFDRIGRTIPKFMNVNLEPTFVSLMGRQISAVDSAIRAGNAGLFATAFRDLTAACNSCHEALDHGFLVVRVPEPNDLVGYANQDFRPVPAAAPAR